MLITRLCSCHPPQISGSVRLQAPEGRRAGAEERGDVSGDGEVSRRLVQRHLAADGRLRRLPGKLRDPRVQVSELRPGEEIIHVLQAAISYQLYLKFSWS